MKIILASASPRRKELMSRVAEDFEVIPADCGERADMTLPPERVALSLAEQKCLNVWESHRDDLVIGCDTVVVYGGKILGKPHDERDAEQTLRALSGKTHSVITGVCVKRGQRKVAAYAKTQVRFNRLTDGFIKAYVASGSPMDKAGSYGIQDGGVAESYDGSYENVVGLPVELTKKLIEEVLSDEQTGN